MTMANRKHQGRPVSMEEENILEQLEAEVSKMMDEYRTPVDHYRQAVRTAKALQRFICDTTELPPEEVQVNFDLDENSCKFNVQIGDDE